MSKKGTLRKILNFLIEMGKGANTVLFSEPSGKPRQHIKNKEGEKHEEKESYN